MDQFLRDAGQIPINYMEEVAKWSDPEYVAKNEVVVRIPEKCFPCKCLPPYFFKDNVRKV